MRGRRPVLGDSAWPPRAALELAQLLMCALSEALTPEEEGELRVITSRTDPVYFFVVDPARRGRCAGGIRDPHAGWRFFHGRYACAPEELEDLDPIEIADLTSSALEAFAAAFGRGTAA